MVPVGMDQILVNRPAGIGLVERAERVAAGT